MRKNHLVLMLLFITGICTGQQQDYIFGQLVDATQNEPIPFASIRIKDRSLGVISNIDGTFKIPLRYRTLGGDVIQISCMGYESKELSVQDLKEGQSNIIVLEPGAFELTEAIVSANIRKLSAKQIVKIAVNSIPQNFPIKQFGLVGYYRDYQVRNGEYTNLNEAIIKVIDSGFTRDNSTNNRYNLFSYNKNTNFVIDSFAKQPYDYRKYNKVIPNAKMINDGGNEFITLIIHDAIRNYGIESFSFVDNLALEFIENHKFKLLWKSNYNEESIYEIQLSFRNKDYFSEGKIYIGTDDFTINKFDYSVFKRKKPGELNITVNQEERFSDGFKITNKELIYRIVTEYSRDRVEKKMFLNYISFYNKVLIQRPAEFKSKFVIDLLAKRFQVRLNKIPIDVERIKKRDFKITYKEKSLPIKRIRFYEDERRFRITPDYMDKKARPVFDLLFEKNELLRISDLEYAYANIEDSLGNKLDERKWEYVHQYREFFIQEIQPKVYDIADSTNLMLKDLPLDDSKQPISDKNMKNEYWMNTPLSISSDKPRLNE